jgi:hypothetical protein
MAFIFMNDLPTYSDIPSPCCVFCLSAEDPGGFVKCSSFIYLRGASEQADTHPEGVLCKTCCEKAWVLFGGNTLARDLEINEIAQRHAEETKKLRDQLESVLDREAQIERLFSSTAGANN